MGQRARVITRCSQQPARSSGIIAAEKLREQKKVTSKYDLGLSIYMKEALKLIVPKCPNAPESAIVLCMFTQNYFDPNYWVQFQQIVAHFDRDSVGGDESYEQIISAILKLGTMALDLMDTYSSETIQRALGGGFSSGLYELKSLSERKKIRKKKKMVHLHPKQDSLFPLVSENKDHVPDSATPDDDARIFRETAKTEKIERRRVSVEKEKLPMPSVSHGNVPRNPNFDARQEKESKIPEYCSPKELKEYILFVLGCLTAHESVVVPEFTPVDCSFSTIRPSPIFIFQSRRQPEKKPTIRRSEPFMRKCVSQICQLLIQKLDDHETSLRAKKIKGKRGRFDLPSKLKAIIELRQDIQNFEHVFEPIKMPPDISNPKLFVLHEMTRQRQIESILLKTKSFQKKLLEIEIDLACLLGRPRLEDMGEKQLKEKNWQRDFEILSALLQGNLFAKICRVEGHKTRFVELEENLCALSSAIAKESIEKIVSGFFRITNSMKK